MHDISTLLDTYRPDGRAIHAVRSVKATLLVGISGAGKDTVKNELIHTGHYHDIVTHTTRKPRMNHGVIEQEGMQYHFTDKSSMIKMLENHELIEVNQYGDNLYGTSVVEFQQAHNEGKIAVADIDVNGVRTLVGISPDTVHPVFLVPPSYDIWYERWKKRYGEHYVNHLDDLATRRQTAIDELRHVLKTPYFFIVINDDLQMTIEEVDQISRLGMQNPDDARAGRAAVEALLVGMKKN